ncbi:SAM-dependent methyltransferase [Kribbella sp. NPDC049174]|uniref:SAM-dependent methyltransferase n=1 Tax=Kribbella sp. NPDC049174 TaxID=3364112 RepID=UPI00371C8C33
MTSGDPRHATQRALAMFPVITASTARVWNLALGGKDNFRVDRDVLAAIHEVAPGFSALATANQQFVSRAATYLARLGITQYLDCGPGLPPGDHIHDVVQKINPAAKVLYVDNDPIVLSHAHALLATNANTHVLDSDIFAPDELLKHKDVTTFLDWSRPIAIFHTANLHHHHGDGLTALLQTYIDAAAPGSCTVISHFLDPEEPAITARCREIEKRLLDSTLGTGWFRTLDQIHAMFPGQDLLSPGLVPCHQWPNDDNEANSWIEACIAGGIGQKRDARTVRRPLSVNTNRG